MSLKVFLLFIASGLVLLLSSAAFAGVLTIQVETTLGTEDDRLRGTMKVTNKGDEPALDLRAEIQLPGEMLRKEVGKKLEPQASASLAFDCRLAGLKKGTYPLPITVIFHDAKLYPFSALSCPVFSHSGDGQGEVTCTAPPVTFEERGAISFTLKHLGPKARTVQAMVLLPREFHSPRTREALVMEPGTTAKLTFDLLNATALHGAHYPVYGVFQYDTGDMHQTLVVPATLKISEKSNWFAKTRWCWLLGGLMATAVIGARRFKKS